MSSVQKHGGRVAGGIGDDGGDGGDDKRPLPHKNRCEEYTRYGKLTLTFFGRLLTPLVGQTLAQGARYAFGALSIGAFRTMKESRVIGAATGGAAALLGGIGLLNWNSAESLRQTGASKRGVPGVPASPFHRAAMVTGLTIGVVAWDIADAAAATPKDWNTPRAVGAMIYQSLAMVFIRPIVRDTSEAGVMAAMDMAGAGSLTVVYTDGKSLQGHDARQLRGTEKWQLTAYLAANLLCAFFMDPAAKKFGSEYDAENFKDCFLALAVPGLIGTVAPEILENFVDWIVKFHFTRTHRDTKLGITPPPPRGSILDKFTTRSLIYCFADAFGHLPDFVSGTAKNILKSMNNIFINAGAEIGFVGMLNWTKKADERNHKLEQVVNYIERHGRQFNFGLDHSRAEIDRELRADIIADRETEDQPNYFEARLMARLEARIAPSVPQIERETILRTLREMVFGPVAAAVADEKREEEAPLLPTGSGSERDAEAVELRPRPESEQRDEKSPPLEILVPRPPALQIPAKPAHQPGPPGRVGTVRWAVMGEKTKDFVGVIVDALDLAPEAMRDILGEIQRQHPAEASTEDIVRIVSAWAALNYRHGPAVERGPRAKGLEAGEVVMQMARNGGLIQDFAARRDGTVWDRPEHEIIEALEDLVLSQGRAADPRSMAWVKANLPDKQPDLYLAVAARATLAFGAGVGKVVRDWGWMDGQVSHAERNIALVASGETKGSGSVPAGDDGDRGSRSDGKGPRLGVSVEPGGPFGPSQALPVSPATDHEAADGAGGADNSRRPIPNGAPRSGVAVSGSGEVGGAPQSRAGAARAAVVPPLPPEEIRTPDDLQRLAQGTPLSVGGIPMRWHSESLSFESKDGFSTPRYTFTIEPANAGRLEEALGLRQNAIPRTRHSQISINPRELDRLLTPRQPPTDPVIFKLPVSKEAAGPASGSGGAVAAGAAAAQSGSAGVAKAAASHIGPRPADAGIRSSSSEVPGSGDSKVGDRGRELPVSRSSRVPPSVRSSRRGGDRLPAADQLLEIQSLQQLDAMGEGTHISVGGIRMQLLGKVKAGAGPVPAYRFRIQTKDGASLDKLMGWRPNYTRKGERFDLTILASELESRLKRNTSGSAPHGIGGPGAADAAKMSRRESGSDGDASEDDDPPLPPAPTRGQPAAAAAAAGAAGVGPVRSVVPGSGGQASSTAAQVMIHIDDGSEVSATITGFNSDMREVRVYGAAAIDRLQNAGLEMCERTPEDPENTARFMIPNAQIRDSSRQ